MKEMGPVRAVPIGTVTESTDNPRRIPPSAVDIVAKSIAEFGWQQPLVVDVNHVVIAGHTRLRAAKQLKLATVPVVVASELTSAQVRAYRIADNRSGDFTSWDFAVLTRQLDDLADDFADVLALADWRSIVASYDANTNATERPTFGLGDDVAPPDPYTHERAQDEATTAYLSKSYALVVVCDSETTARTLAASFIDMPGVIDVRDKRA